MEYAGVVEYYRDARVRREVLDYCGGRWVAVAGSHAFARYWASGAPYEVRVRGQHERPFLELRSIRLRTNIHHL